MNPTTGINYFMIGGPHHGQEVSFPHQVVTYATVVDGNEERYEQASVNLFGRRLAVLVHISQNGNETRTNDALAHGLLNFPGIYQVWSQSPHLAPPAGDPLPGFGADDTRVEPPLADATR